LPPRASDHQPRCCLGRPRANQLAATTTNGGKSPMNELLDYSSWLFQLVFFLVVMYLVVGLVQPKWVLATRRRTIVIVSGLLLLIASRAF
jgi:hypothetical protein